MRAPLVRESCSSNSSVTAHKVVMTLVSGDNYGAVGESQSHHAAVLRNIVREANADCSWRRVHAVQAEKIRHGGWGPVLGGAGETRDSRSLGMAQEIGRRSLSRRLSSSSIPVITPRRCAMYDPDGTPRKKTPRQGIRWTAERRRLIFRAA